MPRIYANYHHDDYVNIHNDQHDIYHYDIYHYDIYHYDDYHSGEEAKKQRKDVTRMSGIVSKLWIPESDLSPFSYPPRSRLQNVF